MACLAFALLGLLVFQVNWLLKSAELKENHFKHRVTMALCSAVEDLGKDKQVCSALSSCSVKQGTGLVEFVGMRNTNRIEKTVGEYLNHYQVNTPYEVSLSKTDGQTQPGYAEARIKNTDNAMIHVNFPSREDFILSELNGMFITSFLLIGLLIVVCLITLQWMFRQQKIHAQTIDYIDGMSHELKTPINNISLAITMLEKQFEDIQPERVQHYLSVAKKENDTLRHKISEVLGTASLERILNQNPNRPCDLHGLVSIACEKLSVKIDQVGATIDLLLAADDSTISGNPDDLTNALVCLLDNALTYDEKELRIWISTENSGGHLILRMRDNGVGISQDCQHKVFEKYYRNDSEETGFGVGLFLVKKIIEAHQGQIGLKSNLGEGSEFSITLPLFK